MRSFFLLIITVFFFLGCDHSQNTTKTIAFISLSKVDNNTFIGFKNQMKEMGWEEKININYIITNPAQEVSNLPKIVQSVVDQKPDLILVSSTPATQEVKKQTQNKNIPVVFCPVSDPINANIVQNTKKPEANITGVRLPLSDIKRTEWLYKLVPTIKTIFLPYTPHDNSSELNIKEIKSVAKNLSLKVITKPLTNGNSIDQFMNTIPSNIDAIILPRDSLVESQIDKFAKYAIKHKLPLSVPSYQQVQKGALYTFGFIHHELGKDAAKIADKILRGVKVTDLPIKFGNSYLVINEDTANKIGIQLTDDVRRNAKLIIKE